jgi:hypothetical protein
MTPPPDTPRASTRSSGAGDTFAFIVRIWYEALDEDGTVKVWRGSVERVAGRQRLFFSDLDSITAYIRSEAGLVNGDTRTEC